jgi:hypothetical protein
MSVLELEELVKSLSKTEKDDLRALLDSDAQQDSASVNKPLVDEQMALSWLDELQAQARDAFINEGERADLPTDLAATFRQQKRDSLFDRPNSSA